MSEMPEKIQREDLVDAIHELADEVGRAPKYDEMADKGRYSPGPFEREFGTWNEALLETGYTPNSLNSISESELIEELERLHTELGRTPTIEDMNDHGKYSQRPYSGHFGSWTDALKSAGLTPNREINIPVDDLLAELKHLSERIGKVPSASDMGSEGNFSTYPYLDRFGSWRGALEEAGFSEDEIPPAHIGNGAGRDELIDEIRSIAEKLQKIPTREDMNEHGKFTGGPYTRRFGGWNNARKEAGVCSGGDHLPESAEIPLEGARSGSNPIPEEDLLDALESAAAELGRPPTGKEVETISGYTTGTYIQRFGSFQKAKKLVGLDAKIIYPSRRVGTEDSLLEEIDRLADIANRTPRTADVDAHSKYSIRPFRREFGTWNNALRAAGYEPNHINNISKSELLDELKRLAERIGSAPSQNLMMREGKFSPGPYESTFESWNDALREAGLEPLHLVNESCGVYPEYYGANWPKERKNAIERDNKECRACGTSREEHRDEYGRDLDVHHIKPVTEFEQLIDAHYLENLITLCWSCHRKAHSTGVEVSDLATEPPAASD
ncbi:homing endonuclease associated repeat-containing protein [Halomontanus rarus]|uniref:homing endonuclease associated repeat-containing protein n=1 Tax=Halomontanus rarus TaxID=3034020 RepID=UPI00307BCBEC